MRLFSLVVDSLRFKRTKMAELILNTVINIEQEIILFPKTVDDFVNIKRKV